MTVTGIDHVQIAAPPACEETARAFYGGLLGLQEVPKPPLLEANGGCWFRAGAQELHVGVEREFAPARKAHPGFVVDDLAALREQLAAAGHATLDDDRIPGTTRCYVDDPFGNRLELRQA